MVGRGAVSELWISFSLLVNGEPFGAVRLDMVEATLLFGV